MLEMKEICETCEAPLGEKDEAFICSYECTFCPPCNEKTHKGFSPIAVASWLPGPKDRKRMTDGN